MGLRGAAMTVSTVSQIYLGHVTSLNVKYFLNLCQLQE